MCPSSPYGFVRRCAVAVATGVLSAVPGPAIAEAQTPPQAPAVSSAIVDTTQSFAVKTFLDCRSRGCDFDFLRDQVRWVNWVRDRLFADVLLLVTTLQTGSGGTEYTIAAIGGDRYRGRADTAIVIALPNDADDVVRRRLARTFSLLLAPYAAKTPLADRINLAYAAPTTAQASPKTTKDPWNFWVYRVSANGFANGEKQSKFLNMFFNTSANRVTAAWKINTSANLGYDESRFDLGDDGTFLNLQRSYGGNALVVKSVTDHFSIGGSGSAQYSDFFNQRLNARLSLSAEYNIFPYKDFTRRQLTTSYSIGVASYRYKEETLYGRISETRPIQNASVSWNARQPWGNVNVNVFGSQYLHDLAFYNVGIGGNIGLRIAKGLSINLGGNFSRVNDQLYLRRGKLSDNQIIARQQALATNFRYFGNVGVSYTFGSIFNTIVNPRFGGSRGGDSF
jgi:hypothetical protein